MTRRTPLTFLTMSFALLGCAATAAAEGEPVLKVRELFEPSKPVAVFSAPKLAAAAQTATTASTGTNAHQFGIGLRLGVEDPSVGVSARYFFYGGPLGVQGELSWQNVDLGRNDFSTTRFSPSVIYRFIEYKFNGPVSLTPYVGAGLSFIHSDFDEDNFPLDLDDTSVGVLLYGGVELFFTNVPNLGVSGELSFNSNDDFDDVVFGNASLGGVTFTAAGHWYFW